MIERKISFTYEEGSMPASYIHLKDVKEMTGEEVVGQIKVDESGVDIQGIDDFKGELVIDVDKDGKILGIEILGNVIPDELKN